jgi:hypothetical protein
MIKVEIFMAVKITVVVFRVVMLCGLAGGYQHFRGIPECW